MEIRDDVWVDGQVQSLFARGPLNDPNAEQGLMRFRQARRAAVRRRALVIAVPLLLSGSLLFPATRVYAGRCLDACVSGTSFVWSKLQRPVVADRRMAPDFALPDADGRTVRLSELRGKVVILNFWATWCPPCVKETPWFVEFQSRYAARGFTVVGAALDEDGWKSVRPFVEKAGVNYPVVIGNDDLVQTFGKLDAVPATLIIDRLGRIAVIHQGVVEKGVYEKEIEAALRE